MAEKSIKRNYIYSTAFNVLMVLTPLVTAPYIARIFRADGVGALSFAASIAAYFALLADIGTGSYGTRETAYLRDNPSELSRVFWELLILRTVSMLIALSLYLIAVIFFVKSYRIIFFINAIPILCSPLSVTWFCAGVEDFGNIVFRNVLVKIFDIAFLFTFVKEQSDIPLFAFTTSISAAIGNVIMWSPIRKYITKPDIKSLKPFRNMKTILSLFLPSVAIQIYTVLDKSMLGMFTESTFENGYYEQSMRLSKLVLPVVTSLAGVMIPRIGYLFGKNDREKISFYMYRSFNFIWCAAVPLCFGIIGVSDNFVPWFLGPGYDKVSGLLKLSSFLIIIIAFSNATGIQYLIPTKRQHLFTYSVILGAVINFSLNLIMIPLYQSYGAMCASVIAEFAVSGSELYMIRRELSVKRILLSGLNYIIAGVIMLSVLLMMNRIFAPSVVHTFTMVFTGAAVYGLCLLIMRDEFFLTYSAKPINFIRRKIGF